MVLVAVVGVAAACSSLSAQQPAADSNAGFDIREVQRAVAENERGLLDESGMSREAGAIEAESIWVITIRIVAYLALVLGLLWGGIWLFKRLTGKAATRPGGGSMDVLEILPIGQGRSIALVRILDAVLVLAQSAQTVALLEKIEGEKALELIASTRDGTSIVQFKELFNTFIGRMKKS
jgi:flagellar biosynthetic protein FliO